MPLRRNTPSGHKTPSAGFGPAALCFLVFFLLSALTPFQAEADWSPLIDRMIRDGKDERIVSALFAHPETRFDPDPMKTKIESLMRYQLRRAVSGQNVGRDNVYRGFLAPGPISRAHAYAVENRATLKRIRNRYCVPEEIVVAILLVETDLGRNTGARRAFNTLASMALTGELDMIRPYLDGDLLAASSEEYARRRLREKSDWAYNELLSLIFYARHNEVDALEISGSLYGAIGLCQFMPSNVVLYGVDADGDGRIDLFNTEDALHSIGKYLSSHGWKCRISRKRQHRIVMAYNHSRTYANTVLAVAEKLRNSIRSEGQSVMTPDPS
jgi:membrane-bound lytic murein transglycosylase B